MSIFYHRPTDPGGGISATLQPATGNSNLNLIEKNSQIGYTIFSSRVRIMKGTMIIEEKRNILQDIYMAFGKKHGIVINRKACDHGIQP